MVEQVSRHWFHIIGPLDRFSGVCKVIRVFGFFSFLAFFDQAQAHAGECGNKSSFSIEDRIRECANLHDSIKVSPFSELRSSDTLARQKDGARFLSLEGHKKRAYLGRPVD
jgi:hypothetical protein